MVCLMGYMYCECSSVGSSVGGPLRARCDSDELLMKMVCVQAGDAAVLDFDYFSSRNDAMLLNDETE